MNTSSSSSGRSEPEVQNENEENLLDGFTDKLDKKIRIATKGRRLSVQNYGDLEGRTLVQKHKMISISLSPKQLYTTHDIVENQHCLKDMMRAISPSRFQRRAGNYLGISNTQPPDVLVTRYRQVGDSMKKVVNTLGLTFSSSRAHTTKAMARKFSFGKVTSAGGRD